MPISGAIKRNWLQTWEFPLDHIDYEYCRVRTIAIGWQLPI